MNTEELNIPRCKALLKYLEENPENHRQSTWGRRITLPLPSGGTKTEMCAAGTACMLAGAEFLWQQANHTVETVEYVVSSSLPVEARLIVDGREALETRIPYAARHLLGLSAGHARILFYEASDLAQVRGFLEPLIEAAEKEQLHRACNEKVMHQIFADHKDQVFASI